jgi:omega-6 fatty acid desaturase (delta-12 desaturase)
MEQTTRTGRDLVAATRPFAAPDRARSWWHVATTFVALGAAIAVSAAAPWWPLRIVGAVVQGLLMMRAFILYHDYMHGALLRGSTLARGLFHVQGVLWLTPARIWNDTHNHHHANTARISAIAAGTFTTWTTEQWRKASTRERFAYVFERHPLTMVTGYLTAFFLSLCLLPFLRNPRRYWTGGLAVLVHVALSVAVWTLAGPAVYLTALLLPSVLAYGLGVYLFYAQHNFPEVSLRSDEDWTYADAALEASSYMRCGPVMAWFLGNIGYHHVHHLNPRIPFFRLPEAMAAIPELQNPRVTTLHPREVLACLQQNLWDPSQQRMVRYREVRDVAPAEHAPAVSSMRAAS